jgi:hypothetical protein
MEIRNEINQILRDWKYEAVNTNEAIDSILRLFSVSSRYSLSYLDGQEFEQKTEVWAKDQDDALKQLEKICPNATYIFISRL